MDPFSMYQSVSIDQDTQQHFSFLSIHYSSIVTPFDTLELFFLVRKNLRLMDTDTDDTVLWHFPQIAIDLIPIRHSEESFKI